MAHVTRSYTDGRYVGSKAVGEADVWTDVALSSLDSATAEAIPSTVRAVDLFFYNSGEAAAHVLLRAHGTLDDSATTGALVVPAGTGRSIGVNLPDAPVSTIAVRGALHVEMIGV